MQLGQRYFQRASSNDFAKSFTIPLFHFDSWLLFIFEDYLNVDDPVMQVKKYTRMITSMRKEK